MLVLTVVLALTDCSIPVEVVWSSVLEFVFEIFEFTACEDYCLSILAK